MVGPCWALLFVGLAIALIPGLPTAAERGAAVFADPTGYANAVLGAGPVPRTPELTAASPWTTASVTFGILATLLAVGMAAGWLWSPALGSRWQRRRSLLGRPVRALHDLHAGHIGDYVAWAMLGSACIGVALVVAA
jgi:multicomponent Na+:H+ antiporter subunit D